MRGTLTIGRIARRTGVPAKTIRYYEETGLIPRAARAINGYRLYDERSAEILRFVKRARDLGFPVEEVAELLALWRDSRRSSADVKAVATRHIARVRKKLSEMEGLLRTLQSLVRHCHGDERPDCPILDDLAGKQRRKKWKRRTRSKA